MSAESVTPASGPGFPFSDIKPPETVFDILRNMKIALDLGLPYRRIFYSDESLRVVSGGDRIIRGVPSPDGEGAFVRKFDSMLARHLPGGMAYDAIAWQASTSRINSNHPRILMSLDLGTPDGSVRFEDVTALWGKGWKVIRPTAAPLPHQILKAPTDPHGNAEIQYVFYENGRKRVVDLWFHHDGTLRSADCLQE